MGYKTRNRKELDGDLVGPLLRPMAQAFNMNPADLISRAVSKPRLGILLAPRLRHAYCPLCFEEDWLSGGTPYFRLDWGRLWATHCRKHATPLFEWVAVNSYGDRRLPHAFYLPRDKSLPLPTWTAINIQEARAWQSSELLHGESSNLWRALIKVEEAWWSQGIGDPCTAPTKAVFYREYVLVRLAALFIAARHPGQRCIAEDLHIPPHHHRVFGYDRRRQGRGANDGNFKKLRSRLPSIQARRTVLLLIAHTLGELDMDLRFETGAKLPSGCSNEWFLRILSRQSNVRVAQQGLRALEGWLWQASFGTSGRADPTSLWFPG